MQLNSQLQIDLNEFDTHTPRILGTTHRSANLLHGVAVAQRGGVRLFERVEVDGDAERHGDAVSARIAPPDRAARRVHLVRHVVRRQRARCSETVVRVSVEMCIMNHKTGQPRMTRSICTHRAVG